MRDATQKIFHDEDKARAFLEAQRWPDGPVCPFCGSLEGIKKAPMKSKKGKPVKGWYHCNSCRKRFTVRVGTLYERSHIPLHKWLYATHLLCASKKGISAHRLHRMLGISYKSAWFMAHRIREGMRPGNDAGGPLGGEGKVVEADETYIGGREKNRHISKRRRGIISGKTLRPIIVRKISRKSSPMTDEAGQYFKVGKEFAAMNTSIAGSTNLCAANATPIPSRAISLS